MEGRKRAAKKVSVPMTSDRNRFAVDPASLTLPPKVSAFVSIVKGLPVCSSVQVAEKFQIPHYNVMRLIQSLIADKELTQYKKVTALTSEGCSDEEIRCFKSTYIGDNGRIEHCFYLTEPAFLIVAMRSRSKRSKIWRKKFVAVFQKYRDYVLEEANRRIALLTRPKRSVKLPVYNKFNRRVYIINVPIDKYTDEERLMMRKAAAINHARSTIANTRKWERQNTGGESAMSYMPVINCPVDAEGNFIIEPELSKLRLKRIPKLAPEAFRATPYRLRPARRK